MHDREEKKISLNSRGVTVATGKFAKTRLSGSHESQAIGADGYDAFQFHATNGLSRVSFKEQVDMRMIVMLAVAAAVTGLNAAEHEATPVSSITVRDGFRVERLRSAQADEGSWISMTFDARGRLILGRDDAGHVPVLENITLGGPA